MSTRGSESATLQALGERGLIALIKDRFPSPPGLFHVGIGDDGAVVVPARGEFEVLTTDALVEGVHFDPAFCSPADVGYKALAVNVSDIAAMGGSPRLALLSLMLPDRMQVADVEGLLDGFGEMAGHAGVALAGGNLTRSPGPLIVDVTVVGSVRPRKTLTRSGGRAGDDLYVTGTVGAGAAGLGWLRSRANSGGPGGETGMVPCADRYRRPEPRFRAGAILGRTRTASACMDLSDGLADAVRQIAAASGTGAVIRADLLPIADCARRWFVSRQADPVLAALSGGDDYELLFAVPKRRRGRLRNALRELRGLSVTRIGELTETSALVLERDGAPHPLPDGFMHF